MNRWKSPLNRHCQLANHGDALSARYEHLDPLLEAPWLARGGTVAADSCSRGCRVLGRMGRITAWRTEIRKREARVARIEHTLSPFRSLPFDDRAARRYAEIRDELETRGEVIGPYDLLIAAIALNHGLTVVTNNREFSRIDGLTVEDWTIARS